jgi:4-hydroxybenzoate polyprenyltransferase
VTAKVDRIKICFNTLGLIIILGVFMELLSFSVSTPFWIWLLFALATAYYYDIMKKRISRLEQQLLDLSG